MAAHASPVAWTPKVLPNRHGQQNQKEHEAILFTPEEVAPPPSKRPANESRGRVSGAAVRALETEPGGSSTEGRPNHHDEWASKRAAAEAQEQRADSTTKMRLVLVLRKYERQWAELSDSQRDAARELGWDATGWDAGDLRPCRESRWRYLRQRQREAAEELLFCGRTWELAGTEADRQARTALKSVGVDAADAKRLPVSSWALGMQDRMTLDELYATAGRVIGFRNMPGVRPTEILEVMRPLLTGHNQNTYELRSAFRRFDPDGDGVVSPTELRTALFNVGIELNTQNILDLLSTMGGSATDTAVDYLQFARLLAPKRSVHLQQTITRVKAILLDLKINLADSFRGFVQSDGYISRRELRAGLFALNAGLTMPQVDDLVELADSEHTGKIDFDAFRRKLGCCTHTATRGVARTIADLRAMFHLRGVNMREAFQAFDRDGDGVISRHELISGLRQLDFGLSAMQVDDVLVSMDMDGDGISYHEFARRFDTPADDRLLLQQVRDEVRALLRRNSSFGGWDRVLAAFEATSDGCLTKQAFQRGWVRAGLNLTERQLDCAFLSLKPDVHARVHIGAFAKKYGQAGVTTGGQMRALANKLCDQVRKARLNPHAAFGLSSSSSRPRKASFTPHEIRMVLHKMHVASPMQDDDVDLIIDMLDPDGQRHISSTRLTAFLHALAIYGVSREILLQLRERMRASSEKRGGNNHKEGWLSASELSVVLASVNCRVRTETIVRMVGSTADEYGRISLRAFLNEMKRAHFVMQDGVDSTDDEPERSGLTNLAYEVRRRVMHALNSELMRNGTRSAVGEVLLNATALQTACRGLNINVASGRTEAFCMLGKKQESIDGLLLSPSIVSPSCSMSRAAATLIDEINLLVDATQVDAWTLYTVLDRKKQEHIPLRSFIPAVLQLGVEMTHTEIQDAWSLLTKGAMTREVFLHHFGQHDSGRKTARVFANFLEQSRVTCHDIFTQIDAHLTGHVLPDHLRSALQALSTNIPDLDLRDAVDLLQLDKHGTITFATFAMHFGQLRSVAALVRKAFRKRHGGLSLGVLALYDRDHKGWISRSEVRAMLSDVGLNLERDGSDELLDAVDRSRDGRVHFDTFLSVVGVAKSAWTGSSTSAVRLFREEIAKVIKRSTGDARELFRLFCGVHEDGIITRSSFFDGVREQRLAMEPELSDAVFCVAATVDSTARDAQKCINFAGFKMLCGQELSADQRCTTTVERRPAQVPRTRRVALATRSRPETVQTAVIKSTLVGRERQQKDLQHVLSRKLRGVRLDNAWRSFDRDSDGRITSQEFIDGLVSLRIDLPEETIKTLVMFMDPNDEGKVDWVEFMRLFGDATHEDKSRALLELTGIFRERGVDLNRTFDSLDRHGDGRVLVEDLCAGLGLHLREQQQRDLRWVLGASAELPGGEPKYIHVAEFNRLFAYPVASQQLARAATTEASVKAVVGHLEAIMRQNGITMRDAFASFDQDGDGVITRSEFRSALRKLSIGLSSTQIDDVLSYVDKDGDGRISFFEFVRQFDTAAYHSRVVTYHQHMSNESTTDDMESRSQSNEAAAVEHILNQLAQEFGLFDDAKARVSTAIHTGVLDPRQLCQLLDRESRGFLVNSDFAHTNWSSRFGLAASEISDLAWVLDFGVDDHLAYGDFLAQLGTEENGSSDYGLSRRRTGKAAKFASGPELEITHNELAEALRRHQISADQLALDLGIALDTYVSWEQVFDALDNMGLHLTAPMRRSLARIRGSMGGGLTLRDFDDAFPKTAVDTDAEDAREQQYIDVVVDLMKNVYYLDFRADVFLGADRIPTATFRRRMNALLAPEVPPGAINVLVSAFGRNSHERYEDSSSDHPGGEIWIQDVQHRCALSVRHGGSDLSERFSRNNCEPLSVLLLRRAIDSAASDDGICQLPHQHIGCGAIKEWLQCDHEQSNVQRRSLSEAGALVELDLSDNLIACGGAVAIARRLDGDRCLQRLLLSNNRICDEGAMQLALLVQASQTLRLVDLANNRIGQKGVRALHKARTANPANIIHIVLDGNCPVDPAGDGRRRTAVVANCRTTKKVADHSQVKESVPKVGPICHTRSTLINVHRLGRRQKVT